MVLTESTENLMDTTKTARSDGQPERIEEVAAPTQDGPDGVAPKAFTWQSACAIIVSVGKSYFKRQKIDWPDNRAL